MSRPNKFVALLLLALWLPATLHCGLERAGLVTVFPCLAEAVPTADHHDADCARDNCQAVESGQFALAKSRIAPAILPAPACPFSPCLLDFALPVPALEPSVVRQEQTPPLRQPWQFARRTALPARAPDTLNV